MLQFPVIIIKINFKTLVEIFFQMLILKEILQSMMLAISRQYVFQDIIT